MKVRSSIFIILLFLIAYSVPAYAQGTQQVPNGHSTQPIAFPFGCIYQWTNDRPDIGLAATGNGDIGAFTAINNTKQPITATITATPIASSGYAYIANFNTSTLTIVNIASNTIVKKIYVGVPQNEAPGHPGNPRNVSVNKAGTRVYVSNQAINSVSIVDAQTNTLIMNVPVGIRPAGLVVSPDDKLVYVTNEDSKNVMVLDAVTGTILQTIPLPDNAKGVAINPAGDKLFVGNLLLGQVSVINTATGQLITNIAVGQNPDAMAVTPDGKRLYVANYVSNSVSVIDIASSTVIKELPISGSPNGLAMSPDGKYVYETGTFASKLNVINTSTNTIEYSLPVDGGPTGVAISPDGLKVYVVHQDSDNLKVIDPITHTVSATVDLGLNGYAVSYGNFMSNGTGCSGQPVTFQITVNPTQPVLNVSGTLQPFQTSYGTVSATQSFIINGSDLEGPATLQAPLGFELSTDNNNFSHEINLNASDAVNKHIYIRLSKNAPVNIYTGIVKISSSNAQDAMINIPSSKVIPAALIITASNQSKYYGDDFPDFDTGTDFQVSGLQNNEQISSIHITVLNGGNKTADAGNYPTTLMPITIIGTTGYDAANYQITRNAGLLTVLPAPLTISANVVSKIYGAALYNGRSGTGFNITHGTLKNADQLTSLSFSYSSAGGNATSAVQTYPMAVTIADATGINGFKNSNYAITYQPADLSVIPAPLQISAKDQQKVSGQPNPPLTVSYTGFVNNETSATLTQLPMVTTPATTSSPPGQYPILVNNAVALNYSITYIPGTLTVLEAPLKLIIPNTFTPNGDGINDTWVVTNIETVPGSQVSIFNRFGVRVFYSGRNYIPWNGTASGQNVPAGVYYYYINTATSLGILSGSVTVIR